MYYRISLLTLIYLFSYCLALAQNSDYPTIKWEKEYGGKRGDIFNDLIENHNGNIIAVGEAKDFGDKKKKEGGNDDILFLEISPEGKQLKAKAFGYAGKEGANAVIQTLDGGYILAGFTNSRNKNSKGKQDALLLKLNHEGQFLDKLRLGTDGNDYWNDLIQLDDGQIMVVGRSNNEATLLISNLYLNTSSIIRLGFKGEIHTIARMGDHYFLGGDEGIDANASPILLKVNSKGLVIGQTHRFGMGKKRKGSIVDMMVHRDTLSLLLENKPTFSIIKTSEYGIILSDEKFGEPRPTLAKGLLHNLNNKTYITGASKLHRKNAIKFDSFIFNPQKESKYLGERMTHFGGNYDDGFNAILQSSNGTIYLAGYTMPNISQKNAVLISLTPDKFPKPVGQPNIQVQGFQLKDETGDNKLEPKEKAYVQVTIHNKGDSDAYDLRAKIIKTTEQKDALLDFEQIIIGHLTAGAKKTIGIPLKGGKKLDDGIADFKLEFSEGNDVNIRPSTFSIDCIPIAVPVLEIISQQFSPKIPQKEEETTLTVVLKNTGNAIATGVILDFYWNGGGISGSSDNMIMIGNLQAGEKQQAELKFKIGKSYQNEIVVTGVKIRSNEKEEQDIPILLYLVEQKSVPDIDLTWITPIDNTTDYFQTETHYVDAKILISSNVGEISLQEIELWVNNHPPTKEGSRYGEISLEPLQSPTRHKTYFTQRIYLTELEDYIFQLKINHKGIISESTPITISRVQSERDLHILSIGINNYTSTNLKNLRFASNDAQDFAAAFDSQQGALFKKIYKYVICSDCENNDENSQYILDGTTTRRNIISTIKTQFIKSNQIDSEDIIILFIASHGFKEDNHFYLQPSDYEAIHKRLQSDNTTGAIDFENDILKLLRKLENNHVFVFIDACYSGSYEANLDGMPRGNDPNSINPIIKDWEEKEKGIRIFTSSSANQQSWEHKKWQNGAFTEAILEALQGGIYLIGKNKTKKVDKNQDGILDMEELCEFVQHRTQYLVQTEIKPQNCKNCKGEQQLPYMSKRYREEAIKLIVLGK